MNPINLPPSYLRITPGRSLCLFICWWVLCWIMGAILLGFIGSGTVGKLRWAVVIQDMAIFLLPVFLTLIICARSPLQWIGASKIPKLSAVVITILAILSAIPAMNLIISWNQSLHLPDSWQQIETLLRNYEESASNLVISLMGGTTTVDLLVSIFLIGVLTAIAEEFFFRGALMHILSVQFRSIHAGIWTTAIVFSAIHMQFFGFFPRLFLGAFFGYLLYWSRSIWLPVMAHAINNSLVVIASWLTRRGIDIGWFETVGTHTSIPSILMVAVSIIVTAILIVILHKKKDHISLWGHT